MSVAWAVMCDPIGLGGDCMPWAPKEPLATNSLLTGDPRSVIEPNDPSGLVRFDAAEMNRVHPEEGFSERIRYVAADVESTGPTIVSVNPIDRYTWGAAAYSTQTNRCYLILLKYKSSNLQYGETLYGLLPEGDRCGGSAATEDQVTLGDWPYIRVFNAGMVVEGAVLMGLGLGFVGFSIVTTWKRSAVKRQIQWVGLIFGSGLMTMGMLPLFEGVG